MPWIIANAAFLVILLLLYFAAPSTYQALERFSEAHSVPLALFWFGGWVAAWQWKRLSDWLDDFRRYLRNVGGVPMNTWPTEGDDPETDQDDELDPWEAKSGHQFGPKGICVRCGASRQASMHFKTHCSAPGAQENRVVVQGERKLTRQLSALHPAYPELPAVPEASLHYEGWFAEVISRINLNSKRRSLEEWHRLLDTIRNLHEDYKKIFQLRFDIDRMSGEERARRLRNDKEIAELEAQLARAERERDAARTPPKPSPAQAITEETEQMKAKVQLLQQQLEYEKLQKQLQSVKSGDGTSNQLAQRPPETDPVNKIMLELLRQQAASHEKRNDRAQVEAKLLDLAHDLGEKFGEPERIARDAKKLLEAWYQKHP